MSENKINQKLRQYLDLAKELKMFKNMHVMVIPIVVDFIRTVSNDVEKGMG